MIPLLDDSARVIGDVLVGEVSIGWPMAVVRADEAATVIGKSAILDLSLLESPAGLPVAIPERDPSSATGISVHEASITSGVLVGAFAMVLDDAVVGEGSIVAAGAVVTPRTVIPQFLCPRFAGQGRARDDA